MPTIIVTGGEGMVGSQVKFGVRLNHKELDILNPQSIDHAIERYQPDIILHLAAMTDMLACENDPEKARQVNITGTSNVATACIKRDIRLVYMSTCAVFDGAKKTPYTEADIAHPISVYGKTKLLGERAVSQLIPDTLIIRTGWLFGGTNADKKFVTQTIEKMRQGLPVKATADRTGSPTYVPDLLDTTKTLITEHTKGIIHVVNDGTASYFEIAQEIQNIVGFTTPLIPANAREIEPARVQRGTMEALISSKIKLRSWKFALKEYIGDRYGNIN